MKKADAILVADVELRMYSPVCRTDDYWETVKGKIAWLRELQHEHDGCPIFSAGDLFEKRYKTNPNNELTGWAIQNLPRPWFDIPGNHDLPGKSIDNYDRSAMSVLEKAGSLTSTKDYFEIIGDHCVYGFPFGSEIEEPSLFNEKKNIALIHTLVYKDKLPFPGCVGYEAQEIMDLLPGFDLIVTGDNHQTFTLRDGDRILVNPGSLKRDDADQVKHKPCVFLWFAEANTIKKVYVPIEQGVISREHIDVQAAREKRLDAFIEKLGSQVTHGVDFLKNLEAAVAKQPRIIKDKVWKYVEGL